jgi:hypothetical protein
MNVKTVILLAVAGVAGWLLLRRTGVVGAVYKFVPDCTGRGVVVTDEGEVINPRPVGRDGWIPTPRVPPMPGYDTGGGGIWV